MVTKSTALLAMKSKGVGVNSKVLFFVERNGSSFYGHHDSLRLPFGLKPWGSRDTSTRQKCRTGGIFFTFNFDLTYGPAGGRSSYKFTFPGSCALIYSLDRSSRSQSLVYSVSLYSFFAAWFTLVMKDCVISIRLRQNLPDIRMHYVILTAMDS